MGMKKRMECEVEYKGRIDGMRGVAGDRRWNRELNMDIEIIWELLL